MGDLSWHGRPLTVDVRRLRPTVELGEWLTLLRITPPPIDTVVFRWQGRIHVAFGAGLPAITAGDAVSWRGESGQVLAVASATDSLTELTQRALDDPSPSLGKGLAKVARLLHLDRAIDRLGLAEWHLVLSDWGPYDSATEPLPEAPGDGAPV